MMTRAFSPPSRRPAAGHTALLLACLTAGCGDTSGVGMTWPVSGKVTLDNQPLTAKSTIVLFKPDASKGNSSSFQPTGTVDAEGVYSLNTSGKKGAPPGWYRVILTAREETPTAHPTNPRHRPVSKSLVPARYGEETSSPLAVEVVEKPRPGAYDLKLTR